MLMRARAAAVCLAVALCIGGAATPSLAQHSGGHGGAGGGFHGSGAGGWNGGGGWHGGGGWNGGWHGGAWHGGGWHGGWHGGVFIGGPWWYGPWWGWPYPYGYAYPYYYYPYGYSYYYYPYGYPPAYYGGPPANVDSPTVYIQRESPPRTSPPTSGYWYYCASAKEYYPKVSKCPEAWIKVPPAPG